jgi:hypothetical protein
VSQNDRSRAAPEGRQSARVYVLLALLIPVLVVIDRVVYVPTERQNPSGVLGMPAWSSIVIVIIAGALAELLVLLNRLLFPSRIRISIGLAVILLITASATWATIVSVMGIGVPSQLQSIPSAAQTRIAQRESQMNSGCVVLKRGSVGAIVAPYQRCIGNGEVTYFVNWKDSGPSYFGLICSSIKPKPWDECVEHLSGHRWAAMGDSLSGSKAHASKL